MITWEQARYGVRELFPRRRPASLEVAIRGTLDWLYRAQDAGSDRGLSHSYGLGRGWAPSYPETTGYAIPTLLNWAMLSGENEARTRALAMADWERSIQTPDGGIQASVIGKGSGPVVFNTGQVMFGWTAAYRETGNADYLEAASRAAAWLMQTLGTGETWSSHGSMGEARAHTYNIRVTWAVLDFLRSAPDPAVRAAMERTLAWVLAREEAPGWFARNCLNDEEHPLLHTISYTSQGVLESGLLIDSKEAVAAATRTADALLDVQRSDGWLAGRYDRDWKPAVSWACLTGIAQTAIVWHRLHDLTGRDRYREAARRSGGFLRAVQDFGTRHPGIRGAVAGSYPVWGRYLRYQYPNWAAKFALDAYLLEAHPGAAMAPGYHGG